MERTLVLIKPDAVRNEKWLQIINHYQQSGLTVVETRLFDKFPFQKLVALYDEHKGKDFYLNLLGFMMSGPAIALIIVGEDAVARVREINGATNPAEAKPGTIRAKFGTPNDELKNAVHGSANAEAAKREIGLFFFNPTFCENCGARMVIWGEEDNLICPQCTTQKIL